MIAAYWDHRATQVITGVVAVNTVLTACVLPQKGGLYLIRWFAQGTNMAGDRLVEFTAGDATPAVAADRFQSQWLSYTEPIAPAAHSHPANSECVAIHGPCGPGAEARIYLRTAMLVNESVSVAIWARYLGGVRAAGPLRPSDFLL